MSCNCKKYLDPSKVSKKYEKSGIIERLVSMLKKPVQIKK